MRSVLRHALHVDPRVVSPVAERIHTLPEVRQGGQTLVVHARALPPDAPGIGMATARLAEPAIALLALAAPDQKLAEPEHRLRHLDVLGEHRHVSARLVGAPRVLACGTAPNP